MTTTAVQPKSHLSPCFGKRLIFICIYINYLAMPEKMKTFHIYLLQKRAEKHRRSWISSEITRTCHETG